MSELQKYTANKELSIMAEEFAKVKSSFEGDVIDHAYKRAVNEVVTHPTPEGATKVRPDNGHEYVTEEYVLAELDKYFPDWSTDGMFTKWMPEIRTVSVEGYLHVSYPSPKGIVYRKIWAVGGAEVFRKVNSPNDPAQPEDRLKAARTEWIKVAAKWLGIGRDVYAQTIPDTMRSDFGRRQHKLSAIGSGYFATIEPTIEKRGDYVEFLKKMPSQAEIDFWYDTFCAIPEDALTKDGNLMSDVYTTNADKLITYNTKDRETFNKIAETLSAKFTTQKQKED